MEIFRGFIVKSGISKDGTIKDIEIPIIYGSIDRVAASISANNTQNLPIRLPTLSAYLTSISLASERYKGIDTSTSKPYLPRGGVFPDDMKMVETLSPIPYKLSLDLHIFSSNYNQMLQILEQFLVLFNPSIQIQTSDNLYDNARITTVTLTGINNEENYPMNTDKRTITYTLNFEMIVYLTVPSNIKNDFIRNINIRISKLNDTSVESSNIDVDWDNINISINDVI
jgi:hypothetical protein